MDLTTFKHAGQRYTRRPGKDQICWACGRTLTKGNPEDAFWRESGIMDGKRWTIKICRRDCECNGYEMLDQNPHMRPAVLYPTIAQWLESLSPELKNQLPKWNEDFTQLIRPWTGPLSVPFVLDPKWSHKYGMTPAPE